MLIVRQIKGHVKVMQEARGFYQEWRVERLRFVIEEGAKEWDIVDWVEDGPSRSWIGNLRRGLGLDTLCSDLQPK